MALRIRTCEWQSTVIPKHRGTGATEDEICIADSRWDGSATAVPDHVRLVQRRAADFAPTSFGIESFKPAVVQAPVVTAQPLPLIPVAQSKQAVAKPDQSPSRTFMDRLHRAADKAKAKFDNMRGKCFRTSDQIVRWLSGGRGIADFDASESSKGLPLTHLNRLIDIGKLKPGMVVYVSRRPGADPMSIDMRYGPHWFTYLGKDGQGVPRFVDQYSTRQTVDSLQQFVPGRKIYQIFDPFPNTRGKV